MSNSFHQAAIPSVRVRSRIRVKHIASVDATFSSSLRPGEKVRRIVYAASSSAYGDANTSQSRRHASGPVSPYAVAKLVGEYTARFLRGFMVETISLRYFNVFGPRQDPSSHTPA